MVCGEPADVDRWGEHVDEWSVGAEGDVGGVEGGGERGRIVGAGDRGGAAARAGAARLRSPLATIRPLPIRIIRSATSSTSCSRWLDSSTLPPRSA